MGQPRGDRGEGVPRRLLVLGGGAIGAEMAQAFARLGSEEVTVVEGGRRDCSPARSRSPARRCAPPSRPRASPSSLEARAAAASRSNGVVTLTLEDGTRARAATSSSSRVGRRPNTADLGLETVGLEPGPRRRGRRPAARRGRRGRLALRRRRLSTACALLTHMGKYQARIAGDVILGKDVRDVADHDVVPRVTFTDPQVVRRRPHRGAGRGAGRRRARRRPPAPATSPARTRAATASRARASSSSTPRAASSSARPSPARTSQELLHSATIAIVGEVTARDRCGTRSRRSRR